MLRQDLARDLTDRQRIALTAVTVEEVPIDMLAEQLGSSRSAIYKMLHDAHRRTAIEMLSDGYVQRVSRMIGHRQSNPEPPKGLEV